MSYILDALRKAEAERQRGQVPGVLAPVAAAPPAPTPAGRRWVVPLAGGVLALGVLGAAVVLLRSPSTPPTVAAPATPEAKAPANPPAPAPTVVNAPTVPSAQPQLPQVVSAPTPVPATAQAATAAASLPAAAAPVPGPLSNPVPVSPNQRTAAAAGPGVVIKLSDLPPEQRAVFPPLALGGSVWSDQPSARFVMVGGQVLREGDAPVPGVVIERLLPKAMWLRWRGQLVEVPL